ncbi:hypothetical protein ACHAXT_011945 [Thalassiosira profunda]
MSADPFRRLFLDQVEINVQKPPSWEALLSLLQLASPELQRVASTGDETPRAFKTLLARVDPNKHPQDKPRATRLSKSVHAFYQKCLACPPASKRQKTSHSPSNVSLPLEFNAAEKWPHMDLHLPDHQFQLQPKLEAINNKSRVVAYQCINARGAIAHGKRIELEHKAKITDIDTSVELTFNTYGSGSKCLSHPEDIKEELMKNGPVVSTSFGPTDAFQRSNGFRQKDVLIIGWKQLSSGEAWIIHPIFGYSSDHSIFGYSEGVPYAKGTSHVAIGQFGIDDKCLAPANSFENVSWEKGPYLDLATAEGTKKKWWSPSYNENVTVDMKSMSGLDSLIKELGTAFFPDPDSRREGKAIVVTVRDSEKKARTRKAKLHSVKWNPRKQKFAVQLDVVKIGQQDEVQNIGLRPFSFGTNPHRY